MYTARSTGCAAGRAASSLWAGTAHPGTLSARLTRTSAEACVACAASAVIRVRAGSSATSPNPPARRRPLIAHSPPSLRLKDGGRAIRLSMTRGGALRGPHEGGDVGGAAAGAVIPPGGGGVQHLRAGDDVVVGVGRLPVDGRVGEPQAAAVGLLGPGPDPQPGGSDGAGTAKYQVLAVDDH